MVVAGRWPETSSARTSWAPLASPRSRHGSTPTLRSRFSRLRQPRAAIRDERAHPRPAAANRHHRAIVSTDERGRRHRLWRTMASGRRPGEPRRAWRRTAATRTGPALCLAPCPRPQAPTRGAKRPHVARRGPRIPMTVGALADVLQGTRARPLDHFRAPARREELCRIVVDRVVVRGRDGDRVGQREEPGPVGVERRESAGGDDRRDAARTTVLRERQRWCPQGDSNP